jgi:hypothetical protein
MGSSPKNTGSLPDLYERWIAELLDSSLPDESLKLASFQSCKINEVRIRLWGYSQYDPIDVPVDIFEQLKSFDGNRSSGLSKEWLLRLYDFGILVNQNVQAG